MTPTDKLTAELGYLEGQFRVLARIEGRLTRDEYREKCRLEREINSLQWQIERRRQRNDRV